jgi:heme-degrading monooxygenase HmoA
MSTDGVPHKPNRIYRVDKFKVPASARAELLDQVEKTHHFLRVLPGFMQDAVLEQTEGPGQFNFVTIAIWESREAIEAARAAVTARHRDAGFNPQEMFSRLGIEATSGIITSWSDARRARKAERVKVRQPERQSASGSGVPTRRSRHIRMKLCRRSA